MQTLDMTGRACFGTARVLEMAEKNVLKDFFSVVSLPAYVFLVQVCRTRTHGLYNYLQDHTFFDEEDLGKGGTPLHSRRLQIRCHLILKFQFRVNVKLDSLGPHLDITPILLRAHFDMTPRSLSFDFDFDFNRSRSKITSMSL